MPITYSIVYATLLTVSNALHKISIDAVKEKKESLVRWLCNEGLILESDIPKRIGEMSVKIP
jgi:hypothetical protein